MEWIKLTDKIPNDKQEVIIFDNSKNVVSGITFWEQDKVFMDEYGGEWDIDEVTHWMPLPAPPHPNHTPPNTNI